MAILPFLIVLTVLTELTVLTVLTELTVLTVIIVFIKDLTHLLTTSKHLKTDFKGIGDHSSLD